MIGEQLTFNSKDGKCLVEKFVLGMVGTNCYIVSNCITKECFIVDLATYSKEMVSYIKRAGYIVKGILLTHGHYDHIMGTEGFVGDFPTTVFAHECEKEFLMDPTLNLSIRVEEYVVEEVDCLKDGQVLNIAGFEVKAIHTPGHTPGGCCYYLPAEGILFTGDTLFLRSIGRTDFPYGNHEVLIESIKQKLLVLPEDTHVYPGHAGKTYIKVEKYENPYVK